MIHRLVIPDFTYTGWEISPRCLTYLQSSFFNKKIEKLDIVEFGSGKSTEFLLNLKKFNNIPGVFDSFDADPTFAHPHAKIREIISYDGRPVSFGNDYSFYKIEEGDLTSDAYDLVILDGHHGHGRSVAWDYLKGKLAVGCVVVIDDYDHYPFRQDFEKVFPNSKLVNLYWDENERWVVYEIV